MSDDDKTDAPDEAPEDTRAEEAAAAAGEASGGAKDGLKVLKDNVRKRLQEVGIAVGEDGEIDAKRLTGDDLKKGAQMIMSMIGQVANQTAAQAARAAKPKPEAGGAGEAGGEKVIDLDEARKARDGGHQPGPFEQRLTKNLRSTFNRFMAENAKITGETEDHRKTVSLDNDFVKQHGGKLVGQLLGAFASSIFPPGVKLGESEEAPAEPVEEQQPEADDGVSVEMNLDLVGLIRSFMPQVPEPSKRPGQSEAKPKDEPGDDAP